MLWKEQLEQCEHDKNWKAAIAVMKQVIARDPENVGAYVRFIYLLHNILLEEDYPRRIPNARRFKASFF